MGSWVEKLPSGKWQGRYTLPDGKKRSAGVFTHAAKARKEAAAKEAEVNTMGWRDPKAAQRTWGEWCTEWWPSRSVEPGTLKRDESPLRVHLMPKWGDVPLIDITRFDVKAWGAEMERGKLAPASIKRHMALFSASLAAALDKEVLTANPAYRVKLRGGQTETDRFLTRAEVRALLQQVMPPFKYKHDEALISLLLGTGMRWGEAVGLQVGRVDLARGVILVSKVWDAKMNQPKSYPKGRRIRDVPIPQWLVPHIEPMMDRPQDALLFEVRGSAIPYSNWSHRNWTNAVERAGIGHTRIHDLRHTYASRVLEGGVSLARVGMLLGHVSPVTTQRYAKLVTNHGADVLAALDDPGVG